MIHGLELQLNWMNIERGGVIGDIKRRLNK